MFTLRTVVLLVAVCVSSAAFAQQPAATGDDSSAAVVRFFEDLAYIAGETKDCSKLGEALNNYLNANESVLRKAAYSDSVAPSEQELAIMNAATNLGEAAGVCFEDPAVATFFERFVKLATELDAG